MTGVIRTAATGVQRAGPSQGDVTIADRLRGKTLAITGASGFLGKAMLALCLRELPDTQFRVLLRAPDDEAAARRLTSDVLSSGAFEPLEPVDVELALESGRLRALSADFTKDALGRAPGNELAGIDVVVHLAASVAFDQALDRAIELNALGPLRLLESLRQAGSEPAFVHISTAYAAGMRTGLVLERPSGHAPAEPEVDLDAEVAVARSWRHDLEAESRRPEHQRGFLTEAEGEIGPAGAHTVGARAEALRKRWVRQQLYVRGRERSRALGWSDSYGLSKSLAERALLAVAPAALTVLRPAIIESALFEPYPGWIEGVKVADPIILAYARGLIPRFPGNVSARLDVVPVDLVARACLAAAAHPPPPGRPRTLSLVSGSRNPLTVGDAAQRVTDHFREKPLPDEEGLPVPVPDWLFAPRPHVAETLDRSERTLATVRRVAERLPTPGGHVLEHRLHRDRRRLERLRRLAELYGPYVDLDCVFDDSNTVALLRSLHPDDRARLDFDIAQVDWDTYFHSIHLPALREMVRALRPPRPPRGRLPRPGLPDAPPALALFDVEGVVLDADLPRFYAWLRGRDMPAPDRALWTAALLTRAPRWLQTDRRSRAAFNRDFYRAYRRLPADELRRRAAAALDEFILPRLRHEAVRRIRAHKRRGDRVVLVTGALDFLVAPLAHLADELVAARLIESRGAFTGELAEPPLTADGRASLLARLADEQGVALSDCHAYGDSVSDLAMLELAGHPNAVNPDFRLSREARRRGWPVLEWGTEPGARTRPAAPVYP